MEVLKDGTELHLASFCLADAELRLVGTDDPAFAALKVKYADVLGLTCRLYGARAQDKRRADAAIPADEALVRRRARGALCAAHRSARPRLGPALNGGTSSVGGFRAQAGRDVEHLLRQQGPQRHHAAGGRAAPSNRRAARRHAGIKLFHQARSCQHLSPAAGAGCGQVEDDISVAAGPVRVKRGAFWSAGGLLAADAGHEPDEIFFAHF